ncbi:MAG: hypothetical protein IH628_16980 [Proteobacteria bacterium]|nr:hypothetical protein [Pseudomonadota bacterium]
MKKIVVIFFAALLVTTAGCQKGEETGKTAAPPVAAPAVAGQAAPQTMPETAPSAATPQKPVNHPPVGDPHAGLKMKELPAGAGHRGKVMQVLDAGSYTYLEVEEKGKKLWIAALKAKVTKGDTVEFPDSKPMENFQSKALNRTFDKIIFAESIRVVK